MKRLIPLALLLLPAGCAGHVADYVGSRSGIVSPQLIRYGLDLDKSRCVAERLGGTLTPRQLRLFARAAGAVTRPYYGRERLTLRDLGWVATSMGDAGVRRALDRAAGACGVAGAIAAAPPPTPAAVAPAAPMPRRATWLNLGAAGSGQAIAIDAATIEQEGPLRSAWFRLTDPGSIGPSDNAYLLMIDCARRTINSKTRERRDAAGAVTERVDYPDNPLPVEGGTVMEIAWLSMCT